MNPSLALVSAMAFALSANQSMPSLSREFRYLPVCTTAQPIKPLKPHAFKPKLSRRDRKKRGLK